MKASRRALSRQLLIPIGGALAILFAVVITRLHYFEVLLRTRKVADTFTIAGGKNPYVSTLASLDGAKSYVVAVNRDCERSQQLSIGSPVFKSILLAELNGAKIRDL